MTKTIPIKKREFEDPQLAVRQVLEKFQEYYSQRDVSQVDVFLDELFVKSEDLHIIGTGINETCQGCQEAKEFVTWDWEYWGNLKLDLPRALVQTEGHAAWVSIEGTVHKISNPVSHQKKCLTTVQEIIYKEDEPREKLIEIMREASEMLYHTEQGEDYIWPIRITAVLVYQNESWLFKQIHFSFPTTRLPDERRLSL